MSTICKLFVLFYSQDTRKKSKISNRQMACQVLYQPIICPVALISHVQVLNRIIEIYLKERPFSSVYACNNLTYNIIRTPYYASVISYWNSNDYSQEDIMLCFAKFKFLFLPLHSAQHSITINFICRRILLILNTYLNLRYELCHLNTSINTFWHFLGNSSRWACVLSLCIRLTGTYQHFLFQIFI